MCTHPRNIYYLISSISDLVSGQSLKWFGFVKLTLLSTVLWLHQHGQQNEGWTTETYSGRNEQNCSWKRIRVDQ